MDYLRIAQYMNFTKSIQRGNTDSLDITDKVSFNPDAGSQVPAPLAIKSIICSDLVDADPSMV